MATRMKTGCLTCRKRKKKCDEKRPLCEFCMKRGIQCEWEIRNFTIDMGGRRIGVNGKRGREDGEKNNQLGIKKLKEETTKETTFKKETAFNESINRQNNDIDKVAMILTDKGMKINEIDIDIHTNMMESDNSVQISRYSREESTRINGNLNLNLQKSPLISSLLNKPTSMTLTKTTTNDMNIQGYSSFNGFEFDEFIQPQPFASPNMLRSPSQGEFSSNILRSSSQAEFSSNILISPSSSFSLFLDEPGMVYLNFFENNVANMISISPRSSNYFLKTFFSTSITNEIISNALAAWGALFYSKNAELGIVNHYFNKAKSLVNENPTDKYDYFITLTFYLISMGVQVCSGDTKNWYIIFNKCVALLKRYGGVVKFLHDFNYSNDCKFLIATFQFHDVMSSETLANGTTCSMNSYNDLFKINRVLESDNYGIDPYQGCIQPIYLLMGEIMNTYVDIKAKSKVLLEKLNTFDILDTSEVDFPTSDSRSQDDLVDSHRNSSYELSNFASNNLNTHDFSTFESSIPNIEPQPSNKPSNNETSLTLDTLRLNHFKNVDEKYFELKNKISCCNPIESQLQHLSTVEERNLHMKLFELYKITCEMYLLLYIRQTQPISTEIQNHLLNSFTLIEELSNSNLIGSLNMSLLICGISCCNRYDRMKLKRLIDFVYSKYRVGNVKRIRDIVEESWRRNLNGNICIDWLEICNDYGWKLSMA